MMPYGYFKEISYTYLWPNFVVGYSFLWFSVDPKLTYSHLRLNLLKAISQLKIIVLFKGKVLILYQLSIYLVATFYAYYLCRKHKKMEIYFELYQMMSIWRKRIGNPYTHLPKILKESWRGIMIVRGVCCCCRRNVILTPHDFSEWLHTNEFHYSFHTIYVPNGDDSNELFFRSQDRF